MQIGSVKKEKEWAHPGKSTAETRQPYCVSHSPTVRKLMVIYNLHSPDQPTNQQN